MLFDEPEAFLDPPQARTLGRAVAKLTGQLNRQVILATHDKNLIQGLVEEDTDVAILHLSRVGDRTTARLNSADEVRSLLSEPILKYSNALDGLFHAAVIVTENDRDSHFYSAVIQESRIVDPAPNLMFISSNGKGGDAQYRYTTPCARNTNSQLPGSRRAQRPRYRAETCRSARR